MPTNLSQLSAKFTDFLRPNLYAVYIFPKSNFANYTDLGLALLCNEAAFPFFTLITTDVFYNNHENSVVNKIDFDPVSFSFFVDKFNKTLKFFDDWRKIMIDENYMIGFYDDYISQIDIELIDRAGNTAAIASLMDAYPINIEAINLSYGENDTIINLQTSFKFKHIEYSFVDRPQQTAADDAAAPKTWKDYVNLSNIRKGVNMISKIKDYRRMIENGNVYDAVTQAGNIFSITKGSRQGGLLGDAVNIFKQPKTSNKSFDIISKAEKLFN